MKGKLGFILLGGVSFFLIFLRTFLFADEPVWTPLKDPKICGYFRVKDSFLKLIEESTGTETTLGSVASSGRKLSNAGFLNTIIQSATSFREIIRNSAIEHVGKAVPASSPSTTSNTPADNRVISFIKDFLGKHAVLPEELYIYFKNSDAYVFALFGNIVPNQWKSFFSPDLIIERQTGFSVTGKSKSQNSSIPVIHFEAGCCFICSSAIEGNVMDSLKSGSCGLGETWKTFRNMVQLKPLFAFEADLEGLEHDLKQNNSELEFPFPLNQIKTFRLFLDSRMVKAQLFAPNDDSRAILLQHSKTAVDYLKNWLSGLNKTSETIQVPVENFDFRNFAQTLRPYSQGTSIFIEGAGLKEAATTAGIAAIGIFSSFSMSNLSRAATILSPRNKPRIEVPVQEKQASR